MAEFSVTTSYRVQWFEENEEEQNKKIDEICHNLYDYKGEIIELETVPNGKVVIQAWPGDPGGFSFDDEVQFDFLLMCNEDYEISGFSDEISDWINSEAKRIIDYIQKDNAKILKVTYVELDLNDDYSINSDFELINLNGWPKVNVINLSSIHPSNIYRKNFYAIHDQHALKNNLTSSEKDVAYIYYFDKPVTDFTNHSSLIKAVKIEPDAEVEFEILNGVDHWDYSGFAEIDNKAVFGFHPCYRVTFNKDNGDGKEEEGLYIENYVYVQYRRTMPRVATPIRSGYTFLGYYDSAGKQYYTATGKSANIWDKISDTTLTARWKKTVEFTSKDFEDVVAFSVGQPYMSSNYIVFFMKNGKTVRFDYKSDETLWSKIPEWFPTLRECDFDGPTKPGSLENKAIIPAGWEHWYLGYSEHLVVKEPYYREIKSLIGDRSDKDFLFIGWESLLLQTDFVERIDNIPRL